MDSQESMEYDVVIVGAGPAGLSAAIKLKQLNQDIKVCVLEKSAQIGGHILSGAVLEPQALKELLPDNWQQAPLNTPAIHDAFYYLTSKKHFALPTPSPMKNNGNFIISLGELCQFLAKEAEALGCELYPGFAAANLLYDNNDRVKGVATCAFGIDKNGEKTSHYQPPMHLLGKQTLFAEGCRGQLSQHLMKNYVLRTDSNPQTYGIGIKEIWQISAEQHQLGHVIHTVGWPLDYKTYGGSFIYHLTDSRVAIGFVVGLDYQNPWRDPFMDFQKFKTHPLVSKLLNNGTRIAYGARALNEGGWQSLPQLTFPGGALIGDAAGFLNVAKIKGIHLAIRSGMYAAEACVEALKSPNQVFELTTYAEKIKQSPIAEELYKVRNIRPGFKYGLYFGLFNAAFETYITRGKSPWTLKNHADNLSLKLAAKAKKIDYAPPDGKLTFDKLSSIYLANIVHDENQSCHLLLRNKETPISINYKLYASPESRYCPANVYEILQNEKGPYLQINAQNCIHCKTCDIKDPTQNIIWVAPEGGSGPNYSGM